MSLSDQMREMCREVGKPNLSASCFSRSYKLWGMKMLARTTLSV